MFGWFKRKRPDRGLPVVIPGARQVPRFEYGTAADSVAPVKVIAPPPIKAVQRDAPAHVAPRPKPPTAKSAKSSSYPSSYNSSYSPPVYDPTPTIVAATIASSYDSGSSYSSCDSGSSFSGGGDCGGF